MRRRRTRNKRRRWRSREPREGGVEAGEGEAKLDGAASGRWGGGEEG